LGVNLEASDLYNLLDSHLVPKVILAKYFATIAISAKELDLLFHSSFQVS